MKEGSAVEREGDKGFCPLAAGDDGEVKRGVELPVDGQRGKGRAGGSNGRREEFGESERVNGRGEGGGGHTVGEGWGGEERERAQVRLSMKEGERKGQPDHEKGERGHRVLSRKEGEREGNGAQKEGVLEHGVLSMRGGEREGTGVLIMSEGEGEGT
ncbi:hypothetical protein CYMTET_28173, partial [Cymbomonas tetramitiformis]